MIYTAVLHKGGDLRWDEDSYGACTFCAPDDETARAFVMTIAARMTRAFGRAGSPHDISVRSLDRFEDKGLGAVTVAIDMKDAKPFACVRQIRAALDVFYPKSANGARRTLMPLFSAFRETARTA